MKFFIFNFLKYKPRRDNILFPELEFVISAGSISFLVKFIPEKIKIF